MSPLRLLKYSNIQSQHMCMMGYLVPGQTNIPGVLILESSRSEILNHSNQGIDFIFSTISQLQHTSFKQTYMPYMSMPKLNLPYMYAKYE